MTIVSRAQSLEAVILAGGQGRRLGGVAKGHLEIRPGCTILDYLMSEIKKTGIESIRIAANRPEDYAFAGVEVVLDLHPGCGPLGGVEAALASVVRPGVEAVLVMPCDMPGLRAEHFERFLRTYEEHPDSVAVATGLRGMEPLLAVVPVRGFPIVQASLERGTRKVRDVWSEIGYHTVLLDDAQAFININTPEERNHWSRS